MSNPNEDTHPTLSSLLIMQRDTKTVADQNMIIGGVDAQNFRIILSGDPLEYDDQVLTSRGLEIYSKDAAGKRKASDSSEVEYILQCWESLNYDGKYSENRYCLELALTLDRASNTAYQIAKRNRKGRINGSERPAPLYSLQICELIFKKIPAKARCLETVLRNVPLHKIQVLFENDLFFLQVVKFLCQSVYKVSINSVISRENGEDSEQSLSFGNENWDQGLKEKKIDEVCSMDQITSQQKKHLKPQLLSFQLKVLETYQCIANNLKNFKLSYQRVNLLLGMFPKQQRLLMYFYDLNKQLICHYFAANLQSTFRQCGIIQEKTSMSPSAAANPQKPANPQSDVLGKLIAIIKTVNLSLGRSEISFQIIRSFLLTEQTAIPWLHSSLQEIKNTTSCSVVFFEFMALAAEISPLFICDFFSSHHLTLSRIVATHLKWICQTFHTVLPSPQDHPNIKTQAILTLDHLIALCKTTIKQTTSPTNIGRTICKQFCEWTTHLRPNDIQFLTYVCCVNQFSRQTVIKYLIDYFRKLMKSIRNSTKIKKMQATKLIRNYKHYLIETMQAIRKISEIADIEFTIDSELLADIHDILDHYRYQANGQWYLSIPKGTIGCVYGAYRAMIKSVRVEPLKQKDSQCQTFDSEYPRPSKEQ